MMKRVSITVFIAVFLTACAAGTDFKRIEINQLTYGSDTPETIKQKLGKPYNEGTITKNEKQFKTMSYAYASGRGSAAYQGVTPGRSQGFYFFQNELVGHEFTSSWEVDSTDFDESQISEIKKGNTTIQEVIGLLGSPNGEYIFPLATNETEKAKVYLYSQVKGSAFSMKFYRKVLIVTHDENGIITEVDYVSSGER
jgi:hypothetical protein